MTLKLAKPVARKRPSAKKPAALTDVAALVRRKPADEVALQELACRLDGRPVPGLRMSEREYDAWVDSDVNSEWVNGEVILMPPVSLEQADLFGWLYRVVAAFVEERELGKALGSEFMIRLARQRSRRVPDILIVLKHRLHLLRPTYLDGAPDIAFEIVGPESVARDWRDKYEEYQAAGVREYWVIDPVMRKMEANSLRGKKYQRIAEDDDGRVESRVVKGFYLRPEWLWKQPLPRVSAVLRELGVAGH